MVPYDINKTVIPRPFETRACNNKISKNSSRVKRTSAKTADV